MHRALAVLFLLPAVLCGAAAPAEGENDEIIIVLRVDDILSRNMTILPRSIKPFEEVAEQRGAVVTWAVIPHRLVEPANEDGALAAELRETLLRGHEISLHGYNHICSRCGQSNHELYCSRDGVAFPYEQQHEMLSAGLRILEDEVGAVPRSFVPPGHVMDDVTFRVQSDLDLPVLSVPGPPRRFEGDPVFNLPPYEEFTWALTEDRFEHELARALADVEDRGERDGFYMFLFHDFFTRAGYENGVVLRWTGALLDSLAARYGSRIRYLTLTGAAAHLQQLDVSVDGGRPAVAQRIRVHPAFPNPSRDGFSWLIENEEALAARLSVYDASGRRVAVPFDGTLPPGRTSLSWSAAGLPAGLYLYRVQAQGHAAAGTIVVAR